MTSLEYPNLRGRQKRKEVDAMYENDISKNLGDGWVFSTEHYSWVDSSLRHYSNTFGRELKDFGGLDGYLNARFGDKKINCLDVGGIGNELFKDIKGSRFRIPIIGRPKKSGISLNKTLGISLHHRSESFSKGSWKHKAMTGDAYSSDSFLESKNYFGDEGVDFIISRMGRGLEFAPKNPFQLFNAIKNYYSMLNDGGSMLLQVPIRHEKLLRVWVNYLNRNFSGLKIKVNFPSNSGRDSSFSPSENLTILIEKDVGAPKELPALSKFDVFRMKKD